MRTVFLLTICVCFLLLLPKAASAQYYQYKGTDGALHYTDNLADVPADQRPNVKPIRGTWSQVPVSDKPQPAIGSDADADARNTPEKQPSAAGRKIAEQTLEKLKREKAALDKTFHRLEAEKKQLEENPPGKKASINEIQAYDNRIYELNRRIKEYQKRRKEFSKKAKAYNKTVK